MASPLPAGPRARLPLRVEVEDELCAVPLEAVVDVNRVVWDRESIDDVMEAETSDEDGVKEEEGKAVVSGARGGL